MTVGTRDVRLRAMRVRAPVVPRTATAQGANGCWGRGPWGVFTFGLGGLVHQRGRRWCGYDWKERTNKNTPLRGQPRTPVVARIVEQVLPTPEPTDPIGDRPLRAALLPERVGTQ